VDEGGGLEAEWGMNEMAGRAGVIKDVSLQKKSSEHNQQCRFFTHTNLVLPATCGFLIGGRSYVKPVGSQATEARRT